MVIVTPAAYTLRPVVRQHGLGLSSPSGRDLELSTILTAH
jgi:hypothetical protein